MNISASFPPEWIRAGMYKAAGTKEPDHVKRAQLSKGTEVSAARNSTSYMYPGLYT
nr:MAG TPA: hypothetical protein [Caudoviricetes sp.]